MGKRDGSGCRRLESPPAIQLLARGMSALSQTGQGVQDTSRDLDAGTDLPESPVFDHGSAIRTRSSCDLSGRTVRTRDHGSAGRQHPASP